MNTEDIHKLQKEAKEAGHDKMLFLILLLGALLLVFTAPILLWDL